MKIKVDGHMLIAFIFSVLTVVISIVITLFSVSNQPFYLDFPAYAYHEYVDRSDDTVFKSGGGAQFYEAEKANLSNGVNLRDNVGASNGKVVELNKKGQTVEYAIKFDKDCMVQLKVSLCYVSSASKDTNAKNLFSVYLNDVEPYTDLANVKHCYNVYEFKENLICSFNVSKGVNVIEIISSGSTCYFDYMVLIPQTERTESNEPVGHTFSCFELGGLRQYYEAERAELKESYILQQQDCSGGYYVYSYQKNGKISFFTNSEKEGSVGLSLVMRNRGNAEKVTDFCDIFINEERLYTGASCSQGEDFAEIYLGEVRLKVGENEIKIVNKNGEYLLDCLILNANGNYSPNGYTLRYEAENATLLQNAETVNSTVASNGKCVKSVRVGTEIEYNLNSYVDTKTYFSLRLRYTGTSTRLCDLFAVYVNRTPMEVADSLVTDMSATQGYEEFFVGSLSLKKGNNEIEIYSLTDREYFLDCVTLYNQQVPEEGEELKCEAEKARLSNDVTAWEKKASGGKIVDFNNAVGERMEFKIQAIETVSADLVISMSNNASTNKALKEYCSIIVNGTALDLSKLQIFATDKNGFFMEYNVGSIPLQKGMNTVAIVGGTSGFYVDYIKFVS